ncbi:MAG: ABC transporter permease [Verrucomicrobiales bacterium]|nr:ABC transporter permease [Verrucomicrobiales bacterium]
MKRFIFLLNDYGMLVVLFLLCLFFTFQTLEKRKATGTDGAVTLGTEIQGRFNPGNFVFISAGTKPDDVVFAEKLELDLKAAGFRVAVAQGTPSATKSALKTLAEKSELPVVIAASPSMKSGPVFADAKGVPRLYPRERLRSKFLGRDNLLNVGSQISKIAIIAIGMTMVIITAGIDLSVGSLVALTAVATAWLIERFGGDQSSVLMLFVASFGGIMIGGLVGLFSGGMVTAFRMPPFIVTLAVMFMASGFAFVWSDGESIHDVPTSYTWLGRGFTFGIPNSVILMLVLYLIAHLVMSRTALGRYIYAVGGNPEAARLSGVPVKRVLLIVYTLSGLLAGVAGVIATSELEAGSATYGDQMELMVIAAVVVGGTSIMGGEGRIFGTLIGALMISVIAVGMNMMGIKSFWQKIVFGGLILLAVLLNQVKHDWLNRNQSVAN